MEALFLAVIGDRVFLAERHSRIVEHEKNHHFFNTDGQLCLVQYCDEFGPMNLASVLQFVDILETKLDEYPDCPVVYCVDGDERSVTNAVFLLGSYMVLRMHLSPEVIWSAFEGIEENIIAYRHDTYNEPDFLLSVVDPPRLMAIQMPTPATTRQTPIDCAKTTRAMATTMAATPVKITSCHLYLYFFL